MLIDQRLDTAPHLGVRQRPAAPASGAVGERGQSGFWGQSPATQSPAAQGVGGDADLCRDAGVRVGPGGPGGDQTVRSGDGVQPLPRPRAGRCRCGREFIRFSGWFRHPATEYVGGVCRHGTPPARRGGGDSGGSAAGS